jgi:hypothetical protein
MPDWFSTNGKLEPDPITAKQKYVLVKAAEQLLDILTSEVRVNAEIMGFDVWLDTLDKGEASYYISVLKGGTIASEVRERSASVLRRKWWHTGLSELRRK